MKDLKLQLLQLKYFKGEKMKLDFNENDIVNEQAEEQVEKENPLKTMLVDYVGNKLAPSDEEEVSEVTVGMIVETLADEFPEFLMVVAEENWIRGYHQAMNDVTEGERIAMLQQQKEQQSQQDSD